MVVGGDPHYPDRPQERYVPQTTQREGEREEAGMRTEVMDGAWSAPPLQQG